MGFGNGIHRDNTLDNELAPGRLLTHPHPVYQITAWMRGLAKEHDNLVTMLNIGTTYEGRPMNLLKVSGVM